MMIDAGPDLDRLIERKLNGDAKKRTPPYSTSEKAANRLLRRLEMQDMPCTIEHVDGMWYCIFWVQSDRSRERLATGSGETRALAIARAVLNARLGMGPVGRTRSDEDVSWRREWPRFAGTSTEERLCAGCGVGLPNRNREAANRYCSVCSWRTARDKMESASRADSRSAR